MANGVKFGRKRKLSDYQRQEAIKRQAAGETLVSIAKSYAVAFLAQPSLHSATLITNAREVRAAATWPIAPKRDA
jgi:hypothetical protein